MSIFVGRGIQVHFEGIELKSPVYLIPEYRLHYKDEHFRGKDEGLQGSKVEDNVDVSEIY